MPGGPGGAEHSLHDCPMKGADWAQLLPQAPGQGQASPRGGLAGRSQWLLRRRACSVSLCWEVWGPEEAGLGSHEGPTSAAPGRLGSSGHRCVFTGTLQI